MTVSGEKIALFIDGANLYATAKSLGFDIDYKRLLREFQSRGNLLRAYYYTAIIEDQEYSSIRPAAARSREIWTSNLRSTQWRSPATLIIWCCFRVTAIFDRWSKPSS